MKSTDTDTDTSNFDTRYQDTEIQDNESLITSENSSQPLTSQNSSVSFNNDSNSDINSICRYGRECKIQDCVFYHPEGRVRTPCKFKEKCINGKNCPFEHS